MLPGKSSKTELAKLIVAQDLFGLWGDGLTVACTAALMGAQKWAGDDVAPVSLLVYLRDSVPAVQPLMVKPGNSSHLVYMCSTLNLYKVTNIAVTSAYRFLEWDDVALWALTQIQPVCFRMCVVACGMHVFRDAGAVLGSCAVEAGGGANDMYCCNFVVVR